MMMKAMKLMMATTLATTLLVTVAESADAQVEGSSISRRNNLPDIKFDLLFKNPSEIIDNDGNLLNDSGLFVGAINNFYYTNDQTAKIIALRPPEKYYSFSFLLDRGDITTRLDGNRAIYTIFSGESFKFEVVQSESKLLFEKTINKGLPIYTFELDLSDLSQEAKKSAVNDLQFIVKSNLYNPSRIQNERFVKDTLGFDLAIPRFKEEEGGSGYNCKTIPGGTDGNGGDCTNVGIRVPEPSTSLASLLFGAFGLGLLLKRKIKMKQS
jgi:hypothetical protein